MSGSSIDQFAREIDGADDAPAADVRREERLGESMVIVMDSRGGRRLMYELIATAGLLRSSFAGDWGATAFNEGRRSVASWAFDLIDRNCPDKFALMMAESKQDESNDRASRTDPDAHARRHTAC